MQPILDYDDALRAIRDRGRFGIRLGLARTRALLRALGEPQRQVRGALVGGTNGKGSVIALAAAAATAAGYRVGQTPKPHLTTYRERLQIDGRPIEREAFARLVGDVLPLAEEIAPRHGPPTEFELLTAMVFRWFAEQRPDLALVEVGLGGRLDATHAWDGGVAVITNVDLDHTDRLGTTLTAIAREKAAIVERGDRAVTAASGEALEVIRRRARRMGVPLVEVPRPNVLGWDRDGLQVELPRLGPTWIGLRGRHQAINAATAHAVLDALADAGIVAVGDDARRHGFAAARWPGRLELVERDGRELLLDGAHNPAGAAALAVALADLRPYLAGGTENPPPRLALVTAMMADKDVEGAVRALAASPALRDAVVVCTQVEDQRALPVADLASIWARMGAGERTISISAEPEAALERALRAGVGPVVVTGSLYLVGTIRSALVDDPDLRDEETERP